VILEELGLPYETKYMDFPDMKKDPFETLNPNGRVPAIEDPNTGVNLFEVSTRQKSGLRTEAKILIA